MTELDKALLIHNTISIVCASAVVCVAFFVTESFHSFWGISVAFLGYTKKSG